MIPEYEVAVAGEKDIVKESDESNCNVNGKMVESMAKPVPDRVALLITIDVFPVL